jgi:hypothetical protein
MNNAEINKLKALLCVTNPDDERELVGVLTEAGARGFCEFGALGVASSELLGLLGLADSTRIVVLCLIREEDCAAARDALAKRVYTKPGKGITIVLRVDGFIGARALFKE